MKHNYWLGVRGLPPCSVSPDARSVERLFRRIVAPGGIPEVTFSAISDMCIRSEKMARLELDNLDIGIPNVVGQFRFQVRVLRALMEYIDARGNEWHPKFWHRGPEGSRFRDYLRKRLLPGIPQVVAASIVEDIVTIARFTHDSRLNLARWRA